MSNNNDQDEQRLILRWHRQELAIVKNLPLLLDNEFLTDVTLSCVGGPRRTIKAHRLVLATCSSYFFQLFQELGDSAQHPIVVVLHDVELEDLKTIVDFIYKGSCVVDKCRLNGLLSVARMLKIQGLCDMKMPEPQLEPINLPQEDQSNRRPGNKELSETCKCFLCGKYLSNQYNLRVHMETHEEAFHACQACPHVSRSRDALRKHVSYRHPEEYTTRKRKKIA